MEVKYFKLVIAIVESGSITKAADKLFLTQSALSHQLREVDELIGTPIFDRVNKKLLLSAAGKIFLGHSYQILGDIKKLKTEINCLTNGETGKIRLTTESATCHHWIPKLLKEYQLEFPNVDIVLSSNPSNRPIDLILDGKVDVAIMHRSRPEKNVEFLEVLTDEVVALAPATDPLSRKKYLNPEDFRNINYITHSKRFDESAFFEAFLKPNGIMPKKVIHIQLTEAIVAMVKEGLGVAVMANWLAKSYLDTQKIKAIRISRSGLKRKWSVASLKNSDRPKYFNRFIHHVKSTMLLDSKA